METTVHRIQRLFPKARVQQVTGSTIEVKDGIHVCWITVADIEGLNDTDAVYLIYGLLRGQVK